MIITIKNDREQVVASFELETDNGHIKEVKTDTCYVYGEPEGDENVHCVVLLRPDMNALHNVSNELLLQ